MNKTVTDIIDAYSSESAELTMYGLMLLSNLGLYSVGFADDLEVLTNVLEEISEQSSDI